MCASTPGTTRVGVAIAARGRLFCRLALCRFLSTAHVVCMDYRYEAASTRGQRARRHRIARRASTATATATDGRARGRTIADVFARAGARRRARVRGARARGRGG